MPIFKFFSEFNYFQNAFIHKLFFKIIQEKNQKISKIAKKGCKIFKSCTKFAKSNAHES